MAPTRLPGRPAPRLPGVRHDASNRASNSSIRLTAFEQESLAALMAQRATRPRTNVSYIEEPADDSWYDGYTTNSTNAYASNSSYSQQTPTQAQGVRKAVAEPREAQEYQVEDDFDYDDDFFFTPPRHLLRSQNDRRSAHTRNPYLQSSTFDEDEFYVRPDRQARSQKKRKYSDREDSLQGFIDDDDDLEEEPKRLKPAERQSVRSTRHQGGMQEKTVDDIYRSDDEVQQAPARPRAVGAREIFQPTPRGSEFAQRHNPVCDSCGEGNYSSALIFCQGCSLAYHHACLGPRGSRAHLVTKIAENDFVLQCKRCIGDAQKKKSSAPHSGKCQECLEHGSACQPFRARKTALQEQKEREDNNGIDPIIEVDSTLVNNANNVLFRCTSCFRGWHAHHLPLYRSEQIDNLELNLQRYCQDWICNDCIDEPGKISNIIAWRPSDEAIYDEALAYELVDEDEKEYLIKFEGQSYLRTEWVPGAWLWSKTTASQRQAFTKREEAQQPVMTTEAAVPQEYIRADIVLDVKYKASIRSIDQVSEALIKYQSLPYEEAFWEDPPDSQDTEQWNDFAAAYHDWDLGYNLQAPTAAQVRHNIAAMQQRGFEELEAASNMLTGGTLMTHQLKGVNWLYFKWFKGENAILGDEMGLGKTIEVIALLSTLVERAHCFPFLIVVPNSTVPNWRREIKRWAPSLKAVTYYGIKRSREMVAEYELFPRGSRQLKCHIVITSYEAAADADTRIVFRNVEWQSLIIDEGQRLKNDKSNLYAALQAINTPFRLLLTGTPLQNNQRELFNLLHFLDDRLDPAKLEQQYEDLDSKKISELHEMIRPHFLRRTKRQVLSLPAMQQVVLPLSMSLVQKTVYKTILTKNADLMRTLLGGHGSKKADKGSLSNILMQLRKCLCHPFVYSRDVEEHTNDLAVSHRNLVDASNKLILLEIMLPMLQADGHRVLIFSQFLDSLTIIEDFLSGMDLLYQRLDGSVSSLERQKRIDKFNAADSPYFAFLLSTRAGGVGINLTSADTVIILDPDFNPHQDLQALSRSHRIGQTKPVLCFRLVTVNSAEERINDMGKRKLALDKALIQHMNVQENSHEDLLTILSHGVKELFDDSSADHDIVYDEAKVRALLDRSNIDSNPDGQDEGNEWSYAEVWKNEPKAESNTKDSPLSLGAWEKILKDRERAAAKVAAQKSKNLGRGRRKRSEIDYTFSKPFEGVEGLDNAVDAGSFSRDDDDNEFEEHSDDSDDDRSHKSGSGGKKSKTTPVKKPALRALRSKLAEETKATKASTPRKATTVVVGRKRGRPSKKDLASAAASVS